MTKPQFYRIGSLFDLEKAKTKKLVFGGAGSGGGFVIADLGAYPWGGILIADLDTLKEENRERHRLEDHPEEIGKPKAEAMERYLLRTGKTLPGTILAYHGRVQDIFSWMEDASLLIVSIDNQGALLDINSFAIEHNIPTIYGGVMPQGVSGIVVSVPTPCEVCYVCAQHQLGFDQRASKRGDNYGLDIALLSTGAPMEVPALRANVSAIAADMAIIAKRMLLGNEKVIPSILFDFIDWDSFMTISRGSELLQPILGYVSSMAELGMAQTQRLVHKEGNVEYQLNMERKTVVLKRWARCPMHDVNGLSVNEL